jgi:hypothetical protein
MMMMHHSSGEAKPQQLGYFTVRQPTVEKRSENVPFRNFEKLKA